jgi:hypothetical protein
MTTTTPEKPLGDFTRFIGTPFESFVLPILPRDATLGEESKVDPANLGRVPGRFLADRGVWTGMSAWQHHVTTERHLRLWEGWKATASRFALGMRLNEFHCLDLDVNDPQDVAEIHDLVTAFMGHGPIRTRSNSPRRLYFFKWRLGGMRVSKMSVTYIHPDGSEHTAEFLGDGQSATLEGPHRSGVELRVAERRHHRLAEPAA